MQEWLKNKKNLPIIAGLAVVVLLVAGGFIAFQLGLFGGSTQDVSSVSTGSGGSAVQPPIPTGPGGPAAQPPIPTGPGGLPQGQPSVAPPSSPPNAASGGSPSGPKTAAVPSALKKTAPLNPAVGPDPFYIPGGVKTNQKNTPQLASAKLPLRDSIGALNLFQIHPSQLTSSVLNPPPGMPSPNQPDPAANYRLSGVITGSDGINAILEVGGQSQSVKPGDVLSDGSRVQNIGTNSLTLRTASGAVISLPLSAGGAPDQGTNNFNNPPSMNGP